LKLRPKLTTFVVAFIFSIEEAQARDLPRPGSTAVELFAL
jgi:hypothetical protein